MPIVDFYSGKATDTSGRNLREIHTWIITSWKMSMITFNGCFRWPSPVSIIHLHTFLMRNKSLNFTRMPNYEQSYCHRFDIMLGFYGFERNNMSIIRSNKWEERNPNWLRTGNHNHLRLTRIFRSLSILGLKDYAYALFEVLNAIFAERSNVISDTTMEYWKHALVESWNAYALQICSRLISIHEMPDSFFSVL